MPADDHATRQAIKEERLRLERVLMFAGGLAVALRKEFAPLWAHAPDQHARELVRRTEDLRKAIERTHVSIQASRSPVPATAPLDPAYVRDRATFEGVHKLVADILAYVAPRLVLLRLALEGTGRPGPLKPWETIGAPLLARAKEEGVPNGQMGRLGHVTKLVFHDEGAARKAHVAVTQHGEAARLHGEATAIADLLPTATASLGRAKLAGFPLPRYRAAIYPLSHLHVTFQGTPHLQDLFPAPTSGVAKLQAKLPSS